MYDCLRESCLSKTLLYLGPSLSFLPLPRELRLGRSLPQRGIPHQPAEGEEIPPRWAAIGSDGTSTDSETAEQKSEYRPFILFLKFECPNGNFDLFSLISTWCHILAFNSLLALVHFVNLFFYHVLFYFLFRL